MSTATSSKRLIALFEHLDYAQFSSFSIDNQTHDTMPYLNKLIASNSTMYFNYYINTDNIQESTEEFIEQFDTTTLYVGFRDIPNNDNKIIYQYGHSIVTTINTISNFTYVSADLAFFTELSKIINQFKNKVKVDTIIVGIPTFKSVSNEKQYKSYMNDVDKFIYELTTETDEIDLVGLCGNYQYQQFTLKTYRLGYCGSPFIGGIQPALIRTFKNKKIIYDKIKPSYSFNVVKNYEYINPILLGKLLSNKAYKQYKYKSFTVYTKTGNVHYLLQVQPVVCGFKELYNLSSTNTSVYDVNFKFDFEDDHKESITTNFTKFTECIKHVKHNLNSNFTNVNSNELLLQKIKSDFNSTEIYKLYNTTLLYNYILAVVNQIHILYNKESSSIKYRAW